MITGKYIRKLREDARISQAELARLAGISQAHVAKIEGDKVDPRLSTVNRMLNVLSSEKKGKTCGDIMSRKIAHVHPGESVTKAVELMKKLNISQMPVFSGNTQVGSIRDSTITRNLDRKLERLHVRDIMDKPFPVVDAGDDMRMLPSLMEFHPAVLVVQKGRLTGIITKSDLLK